LTQPDQNTPDRNFAPISELAAKTDADWQDELTTQTTNPFSNILTFLFTGNPAIAFLKTILGAILGFIPGGSIISDILDDFDGNFILTLINRIFGRSDTDQGNAITWAISLPATAFGWVTGFFNGVTGQTRASGDVTVQEATDQAQALADTQKANSNALVTGVGDVFDRTGTDLGASEWAETYSQSTATNGKRVTDGDQAVFSGGTGNQDGNYRRVNVADETTASDTQVITMIIGTFTGEGNTFFTQSSRLRMRARINAADTEYVFVDWTPSGDAQFGYANGGGESYVGSPFSIGAQSSGATMQMLADADGDPRKFVLLKNGTRKGDWTDGSSVTALGASNRGWGWGDHAFSASGSQRKPASVDRIAIGP
jgi:hypothetical protein